MAAGGSKIAIYGAIVANFCIAIAKFVAASFTGSSAMMSEGIHSLIDTSNGMLLLLGIKKSKKKPNKKHPFGYGKEVYFWSFIVAIFIFSLGGGIAIYEGIHHLIEPADVKPEHVKWSYGVLIFAILFDGASLLIAYKQWKKAYPEAKLTRLAESKDAATFAILLEDSAAVIGLIIALIGVMLTHYTGNSRFDAGASIVIGVVLTGVAYFLARETKGLLIGESVLPKDMDGIKSVLDQYKEIEQYGNIHTMHLSPDEILLAMDVNFIDDLRVGDLEVIVSEIKEKIRAKNPYFKFIFIEADNYTGTIEAKSFLGS